MTNSDHPEDFMEGPVSASVIEDLHAEISFLKKSITDLQAVNKQLNENNNRVLQLESSLADAQQSSKFLSKQLSLIQEELLLFRRREGESTLKSKSQYSSFNSLIASQNQIIRKLIGMLVRS